MNLKAMFPHASQNFLSLNDPDQNPKPQPALRNEQVAAAQGKKAHPRRRILQIVSYRTRTCDTDNLCPKWFIDALRYSGCIEDDSPEHIELQIRQEKVAHRTEERTVINLEM